MSNTSDLMANGTHYSLDVFTSLHAVAIVLILIVNVVITGMVFVVFYRRPSLLTLSNRLVLNLSIANAFLTTLVLPFSFVASFTNRWQFGVVWCTSTGILTTALFAASILTLLVISVDRYFAVMHPLHYSMYITSRRVGLCLGAVWLCAVAGALPPAFSPGLVTFSPQQCLCGVHWAMSRIYAIAFAVVFFLMPLLAMLIIYVCIFRAAKLTSARVRRNSSDVTLLQQVVGCGAPVMRRRSSGASLLQLQLRRGSSIRKNIFIVHKDDRKAAITGVVVMSTFLACWLPYFAVIVAEALLPDMRMLLYLRPAVTWIAMWGCAMNPLVYVFRSRLIKAECRRLFCVLCWDTRSNNYSSQNSLRSNNGVQAITPNLSAISLVSCSGRIDTITESELPPCVENLDIKLSVLTT